MTKKEIVDKVKLKKKIKTMALGLFVITIFSSYFLGSYFMALRTFSTIPDTMDGLKLIYQKASCVIKTVYIF